MATKKLELNSQILGMAQVVQNFLDRLRSGEAPATDRGLLERMYRTLTDEVQTKRTEMLRLVSAWKERWPVPPESVRFGLYLYVDQRFGGTFDGLDLREGETFSEDDYHLTDNAITEAFEGDPRRGPVNIAARLSACVPKVFADFGETSQIAKNFAKAADELRTPRD